MTKAQQYAEALANQPKRPKIQLGDLECTIGADGDLWVDNKMLSPYSALCLRDWLTEWFGEE